MGLTSIQNIQHIDPDDIAICDECAAPFPLRRRALGYTTCLSCGEANAQALAQRNNIAGSSSQSRFRQPATSPLPHSDAHTLAEYRAKHIDLHQYITKGTARKSLI